MCLSWPLLTFFIYSFLLSAPQIQIEILSFFFALPLSKALCVCLLAARVLSPSRSAAPGQSGVCALVVAGHEKKVNNKR
jgi:hypothetical protein